MGGSGSTRWGLHHKKQTVEACYTIDISEVARVVDLRNPEPASGSLRLIQPATGNRMPSIQIKPKVSADGKPVLILSYAVKDRWGIERQIEEVVRLQSAQLHFGLRWYFACPRKINGKKECGRRVAKLCRLPCQRRFACRHCLDLTYQSSQQSHKYDRFCAVIAGEGSGEVFQAVKEAYSPQKKVTSGREVRATPNLLDAFNKVFGNAGQQKSPNRCFNGPL